ncbi:membrane protein, putative [Oceanicola granulosus HTCC2516]|uniref:Membrane protein, putative n=1 Tax=Oceanicola granulosus (strain ATCC BAA-861 / DSM 15982 / KCTC 12143 / HTCC2516) TaxID=314256 RepID=Q2CHM5_OCEGH|nr:DMT family transporter [Oceanicola granulosus]EAR52269.1 membrane protein, putative [Oceanicola granulosus HTCC2516]
MSNSPAPATTRPPPTETAKAALWMLGAVLSFSTMAVAGREVSLALDTFEIMTYRSFVGLAIVLAILSVRGGLARVRTDRLRLHAVRNAAHFVGQNLWFFAVSAIPLAQVFAVEFTSPIWALLLAPLILGERITRTGLLAALVGFVGILVVARPSPDSLSPGLLAAAGAAVGFGVTAVLTRRLTRTESILTILFYLTAMQAVFGLVCALIDGDMALPSAATLPFLVLIGCAGLMAHFCLTNALARAPAAVVMPIDFLRLPLIAVTGMLLYSEPLDIFVFLGGAMIFAANYANLVRR